MDTISLESDNLSEQIIAGRIEMGLNWLGIVYMYAEPSIKMLIREYMEHMNGWNHDKGPGTEKLLTFDTWDLGCACANLWDNIYTYHHELRIQGSRETFNKLVQEWLTEHP